MQYDFNLLPGGALNLDVKGKFFKYRSGTGPIRVRASKGGYVDLLPGQGVWGLDYDSLNVQDRSGANNAGVLIAGDFDFHDDRIAGTVDTVDAGKSRTLAGLAFLAQADAIGMGAVNAMSQLWNPAGSGKNLVIESVSISSPTAQIAGYGSYGTAMATLKANGKAKKLGGASSIGEGRIDGIVGFPGVTMGSIAIAASLGAMVGFREPVVVSPGMGFCVYASALNADMRATFEYFEDAL